MGDGNTVARRTVLRGGRDLALLTMVPAPVVAGLVGAQRAVADEAGPGGDGYFLTAAELTTLRALCARLIPGPPDDPDPGAVEAGVPEFVDLLLGAFETGERPRIWAGGPFSDRAGATHNDFADFLELDEVEELVWRTRIEGSRGLAEREWNGPVTGLQEIYRNGLESLDAVARARGRKPFHELPKWFQDVLVTFPPHQVAEFVDIVWDHCLQGMYGPPEYGGNRGLVGWEYTQWPGDSQPRGYTADEVTNP